LFTSIAASISRSRPSTSPTSAVVPCARKAASVIA
jgi:hypothetical protein